MSGASKLQRAEIMRNNYVKKLGENGIRLKPTASRVVFKTDSGKTVGMPSATERPSPKEGWFMGLPNQRYDFIVLLCQTNNAEAPLDFVFPPKFVSEIWDSLSLQYTNSQVKFDVRQRHGEYELKVKDGINKRIQQFLGAFAILS